MGSLASQRQDIQAALNFHKPGEDVLYIGSHYNHLDYDTHQVLIEDVYGREDEFSLDTQGFQIVKAPTALENFDDAAQIETKYYEEIIVYVKNFLGATGVYCIQHQTRQGRDNKSSDPNHPLYAPVAFIHTDYSYHGAWKRFGESTTYRPSDWDLKRTRWAVISFWRPLNAVTRDNLTIVDKRTVPDEALRPYKTVYPDGLESEGNRLAFTPNQKWHYHSGLVPGDVILIKLFDSKLDGRARGSPHSSFNTENDYGEPRKSIEVRCIVYWENQSLE